MKQQIQAGKQKLIENIEQELKNLRLRRQGIQKQKLQSHFQYSNHYQTSSRQQNNNSMNNIQHGRQIKGNLRQLQKLYNANKQLRKAGIKVRGQEDIIKYTTDPKMMKAVEKRKIRAQEQEKKNKIIEQEMIRTKKLLNKKKITQKQVKQLQDYTYGKLLQNKKEQLKIYEKLLNRKHNISRIQKQQLIQMSFNFLKEWNGYVKKEKLKNFLLANQQFTSIFHISHNQIYRDLNVHNTKQQGMLDYNEMYEFIKSVQITNKAIKPTINKNTNTNKVKTSRYQDNNNNSSQISSSSNKNKTENMKLKKAMHEYFKKVFMTIDVKREGIVLRNKFTIAIQKRLYLRNNQSPSITTAILKEFSDYLIQQTNIQRNKSYYKQLQICYINLSQIQQYLKQYTQRKGNHNKEETISVISKQETIQEQDKQQVQNQSQQCDAKQQLDMVMQQDVDEDDFRKYGWKHHKDDHHQNDDRELKLDDIDKYYGELGRKHGNEIEWMGFEHYRADFNKLQRYIGQHESTQ